MAGIGRLLSLLFFLCPVTDISATVAPIRVKFCMMVHLSVPDRSSPLLGAVPQKIYQIRNFGYRNKPRPIISFQLMLASTCYRGRVQIEGHDHTFGFRCNRIFCHVSPSRLDCHNEPSAAQALHWRRLETQLSATR